MRQLFSAVCGYACVAFGFTCLFFAIPVCLWFLVVAIGSLFVGAEEFAAQVMVVVWAGCLVVLFGAAANGLAFLFVRKLKAVFMATVIILGMTTGLAIYLKFETSQFFGFVLYPIYGDFDWDEHQVSNDEQSSGQY